jgi:hypothetical protein
MHDAAKKALTFVKGRTRADLDEDEMLALSLYRFRLASAVSLTSVRNDFRDRNAFFESLKTSMPDQQLELWDLWYPSAAATGMPFARSRIDHTDTVYVHSARSAHCRSTFGGRQVVGT